MSAGPLYTIETVKDDANNCYRIKMTLDMEVAMRNLFSSIENEIRRRRFYVLDVGNGEKFYCYLGGTPPPEAP